MVTFANLLSMLKSLIYIISKLKSLIYIEDSNVKICCIDTLRLKYLIPRFLGSNLESLRNLRIECVVLLSECW